LTLPQPDAFGWVQAFSPDGQTLVTATSRVDAVTRILSADHALHVWDLKSGKKRLTIRSAETGFACRFERIAVAPDGRTLATVRDDHTIQLWSMATGKEVLRHAGYSARASCLAFSPDGRTLATGHADGSILLWDLAPKGKRREE
jgi:WD40 repeat protein